MIFLERLKKAAARLEEIEHLLSDPSAQKDQTTYQKLVKELSGLRPIVEAFREYSKVNREAEEIGRSAEDKDADADMKALYKEEKQMLETRRKGLVGELERLLLKGSDPNANRDVIVEIRAGTGGDEAALFGADLFRMYSKYAESHGLKVEIMSSSLTGMGGVKEIAFGVSGKDAYSAFKYESGIHRVQRVPQTESNGRIHTSAVTVAVLLEADETDVEIDPKDLRIDVFRASGAGGQHVNKTESAVRITHFPTGVVVSCQDERSQHKNKAKAMRVLRARIFEAQRQAHHDKKARERKEQVGSGDRSGKIRTYNFPDQRVTDHRIGLTLHSLDDILNGYLDEVVQALEQDERARKLTDAA
ncbi:MAG: peptide chain release factor 1 [Candidatus Omnitrophota bacterium]|nr:peptide chain release factor 1 [Candidatus Omnitrophota bacterium]